MRNAVEENDLLIFSTWGRKKWGDGCNKAGEMMGAHTRRPPIYRGINKKKKKKKYMGDLLISASLLQCEKREILSYRQIGFYFII